MMKVKKNKKLLAILLTTVMSLAALTGCGESPVESETGSESQVSATVEAPATTENTSQEDVTINFWHHYSAQSAENETLMNVLIPEFEKENPGIKVNAVSHEWADLHQKILISAQSNTLPDVARLDSAWVPEFQKMRKMVWHMSCIQILNQIQRLKMFRQVYRHLRMQELKLLKQWMNSSMQQRN